MANEFSITASIRATKGEVSTNRPKTFNADWATARYDAIVQSIGTTHETLTISADIATLGFVQFTNADPTNYVEIGRDNTGTFLPFIRLNPGETAVFRFAQGITPYGRANTAAVDLEFIVFNN